MLYGGGCDGSPTPTEAPANGRFNKSWLVRIVVGRLGNSAASVAAGTPSPFTNSGENPTVHAGSQKPQKPVPGACSISVPKRNRCEPFCQVTVSRNVNRGLEGRSLLEPR